MKNAKIHFLTLVGIGKFPKFQKENVGKNPPFNIEFSTKYIQKKYSCFGDILVSGKFMQSTYIFVYFVINGEQNTTEKCVLRC